MRTATKHIETIAQAPNARGSFEGDVYHDPPGGDSDNERIPAFRNVPNRFPLLYSHTVHDPGATVGHVQVMPKGNGHLLVLGRLDLSGPMGNAIHQRMLLAATDPMCLKELSIGFAYPPERSFIDERGVRVLLDVELIEISVVFKGAQETVVRDVKSATRTAIDPQVARLNAQLDTLAVAAKSRTTVGPDVVDAFVAEAREFRRKEKEAERQLAEVVASLTLTHLLPSEAERDERERERQARDLALIERRSQERAIEADERDRVDAARRGGDVQVIR